MQHAALDFLPIEKLSTNPARPRQTISQKELTELADSIRKFGILSPLLVNKKGNTYHIICGELRYRAAKIAGLEDVPCLIISADPKDLALYSLAENLQRSPLNIIDQGFLVSKLHQNIGFSLVEIGESTGLSLDYLEKLLLVLELPERIRRSYLQQELTEEQLLSLITVVDPIRQEALYREYATGH